MEKQTIEKIKGASDSSNRGVNVYGTFVITQCEYKPFKNKPGSYLQCSLSDKTGTVKAVVWEKAGALKTWLRNRMIVGIVGECTRYNDRPQIAISKITEETGNSEDFVPSLPEVRRADLVVYLKRVFNSITNPTCRALWQSLVFDEVTGEPFRKCPGSSGGIHHGYIGGLMEHTTHMIELAQVVLAQTNLDLDLLLTGCLVHDIGKTRAYNWSIAIEMTDEGRLMHHSVLGYDILSHMPGLDRLDPLMMMKLKHICVSHHDRDPGAVCRPMFPEAVAVAMLDNADAAVNGVLCFLKQPDVLESGSNWTRYNKLTERSYFVPQVLPVGIEDPKVAPRDEHEDDGVF